MNQTTTKTKAKIRYLKAKRDRRKKRLKTTNAQEGLIDAPKHDEVTEIHPNSTKRSHSVLEEDTDEQVQTSSPEVTSPLASRETSLEAPAAPEARSDMPALPRFPRPMRPAPPSKETLALHALQGLDRAILEAEIIDPSITAPVPSAGAPDTTGLGLDDGMRTRLIEIGVDTLFAVQTMLLPFLLNTPALHCPYDPPRDACVSAPTGSGKTLAYVVPIVQTLSTRIVTRLRGLIVLPTRDLVAQVRETFETVAKGRGLKIAVATGQHSFAREQAKLVYTVPSSTSSATAYYSKVDVLICTPGRLTDHLRGTRGFTLEHLRFLVIDEADRLITQSFQDWLAQVLDATQPHASGLPPTELDESRSSSCQKLLFSATLTHDPSKTMPLGLRDPRYFMVGDQVGVGGEAETFAFPAGLSEHMCVCSSAEKPLVLFHLIHTRNVRNALVFTKSAESTTRLVELFRFFEQARGGDETVVMEAYSSGLGAERKSVIERFKRGEIHLLVCSDLVARGVDISHVAHVVSYDVPVDMRKYVHRVGRTARAGRTGDAWSLPEDQEARYFKQMLKDAGHSDAVKKIRIGEADLAPLQEFYETALDHLRKFYVRSSDQP